MLSMLPQQYSEHTFGVQRTLSKDETRSVPRATKRLVHLQSLSLLCCTAVTDAAIAQLKGLTQLQSLILTGCTAITDGGIAHLKGLTQLYSLELSGCTAITHVGLAHLKDLTQLYITRPQ